MITGMIDKNIEDFIRGLKKLNTPEEFITYAADNAKKITCATHPSQFSHPYANRDKKFKITPIFFCGNYSEDGYVRSGNVKTKCNFDMYGSAAFATVMKFLALTMSNNKTVLENIKEGSEEAKELLAKSGKDVNQIRSQFLEAFKNSDTEQVTSSKIKQVFFSLGNGDYHLLSLLTPSTLIYELKNRVLSINREAYEKKTLIKNGEITSEFKEVYDLVQLKYGGTQPQNISQLNTENAGNTRLLLCVPPVVVRKVKLPKNDFFSEYLDEHAFKYKFKELQKLITFNSNTNIPLEKLRKYRDKLLKDIVLSITESAYTVRESFNEIPDTLKSEQKIWLNKDESVRIETKGDWDNKIAQSMAQWIITVLRKDYSVVLGDSELHGIEGVLKSFEEFWK